MSNRIITISREPGSGGHAIGRLAAEKLGIPCYDHELIEKIAGESGLSQEYIEERGEYVARSSMFATPLLYDRSFSDFSLPDMLWQAQRKVIIDLAEQGPCVIIGRCGDYILRERHDLVRVFVCAPKEYRCKRIAASSGTDEAGAMKRLEEKDKRRNAYYRLYTDMEWGDPHNYDLCLDSDSLGIEKCAEILKTIY